MINYISDIQNGFAGRWALLYKLTSQYGSIANRILILLCILDNGDVKVNTFTYSLVVIPFFFFFSTTPRYIFTILHILYFSFQLFITFTIVLTCHFFIYFY